VTKKKETKVIAFANHKGGVGKTTCTVGIGLGLSKLGQKVLLVDLDTQANMTSFFIDPNDETERVTIADILLHQQPVHPYTVRENLDLVPSSLEMALAESVLISRISRELVLEHVLEDIKGQYDYILLDCPPALNIVTTNAFIASTDTYVPLTAEALPLRGMVMLNDYLEGLRTNGFDVKITGIIINRFNNRKNLNKAVEQSIREEYGDIVFKSYVRENVSLAEVPMAGGDITEYAPASNGALDFTALTQEVFDRTRKQ
jgi:chromosome partitioning protein